MGGRSIHRVQVYVMQFSAEPIRSSRLILLGTFVGLGACASIDPAREIDAASTLVASRSGVAVDWNTTPNSPLDIEASERPLDVDHVARLALRHHARLRAAVESIVQARADFVQAHLLPNPIANFALGFPADGGLHGPAMGSILQPLAALWRRPAKIDAADAKLRAAVLAVSNAGLQLVAEARLAHARLVFAEREHELERASLEAARASSALVDRRLEVGEAMRLDRNRAVLELIQAEERVTEVSVTLDRARRGVLEVCGAAESEMTPRSDDRPVLIPEWIDGVRERDVIELASIQRLDLAAGRALIEGAVDAARVAELRRIPDVSVGASYQQNFSHRRAVGPALALTLPVFDDGRAGVAKAASIARAAAAEFERVRQGAIGEVRRAFIELRGARANLERQRLAVLELAIDNRRQAEASLAAGVVGRGSLLELQRQELAARVSVNALERACVEWFIELERAAGGKLVAPTEDVSDVGPGGGR